MAEMLACFAGGFLASARGSELGLSFRGRKGDWISAGGSWLLNPHSPNHTSNQRISIVNITCSNRDFGVAIYGEAWVSNLGSWHSLRPHDPDDFRRGSK